MARSLSHPRILLIIAVGCYVAIFNATYRDLVSPVFGFWGFGSPDIPSLYFWTSVILCVVPALWMPIRFARPSLLFFYIQYFLIYIPSTFIVYTSVRPKLSEPDSLALVLMMFTGLSLIQLVYVVPVRSLRIVRLSPEAFWLVFTAASAVMLAYLVFALSASFKIASFDEVYSLRNTMAEAVRLSGSRFGLYAQTLLGAVTLPVLFATGIMSRKRWLLFPVVAGYLFLYGIGGAKSNALAILYLPLAAIVFSLRTDRIPQSFVVGLSLALLLGYATRFSLPAKAHITFLAVVHFRFFTVPPLTIPQYFDFFQTHPVTHFAHVTGFNRLLAYPYDIDIPYTIGAYFYGGPLGANSGMWAGDGIAGFGIWGILVVSAICAVVFWILDSASADFDPAFVGLALTFCTVFFGNVSLFTTLITGGLAVVMLAALIAPRDGRGLIVTPSLWQLRGNAAPT